MPMSNCSSSLTSENPTDFHRNGIMVKHEIVSSENNKIYSIT